MLGHLVLVNFWTLCFVLLFRSEHSVFETSFFPPPQVKIQGSAYSTWVLQTELLSITGPAHVSKYNACLCLLALPLPRTFYFTTSPCGTAQSVNCTTGIMGFRSRQEEFFLFTTTFRPSQAPIQRVTDGFFWVWRSQMRSWPLFCISCRS
jgi:hypothetical protein